MLELFLQQSVWAFLMEGSIVVGILSKIIAMIHYHRLLKETEHMEHVKRKWVRSLKKRFDNYAQLNFKVDTPENFVDKYMELDHICGCSSQTFCKIPMICMLFIALAACQGQELWIFSRGLNVVVFFLVMELMFHPYGKKQQVRTNILLALEKKQTKQRKKEVAIEEKEERIRPVYPATEMALAAEEKEILSKDDIQNLGQILKEWWEF